MDEFTRIGVDLGKNSFQLHAVRVDVIRRGVPTPIGALDR
jgi:hypothetical protein